MPRGGDTARGRGRGHGRRNTQSHRGAEATVELGDVQLDSRQARPPLPPGPSPSRTALWQPPRPAGEPPNVKHSLHTGICCSTFHARLLSSMAFLIHAFTFVLTAILVAYRETWHYDTAYNQRFNAICNSQTFNSDCISQEHEISILALLRSPSLWISLTPFVLTSCLCLIGHIYRAKQDALYKRLSASRARMSTLWPVIASFALAGLAFYSSNIKVSTLLGFSNVLAPFECNADNDMSAFIQERNSSLAGVCSTTREPMPTANIAKPPEPVILFLLYGISLVTLMADYGIAYYQTKFALEDEERMPSSPTAISQ